MEEYMEEVGQNKGKCENCAVVFLFQKKNKKKSVHMSKLKMILFIDFTPQIHA